MSWIIPFFAQQKFRFDLGASFMSIINFAFVVITASDKIFTMVPVSAKTLVLVLVPLAILVVWFIGLILDRFQFWNAYQNEQNLRNKMLTDILCKKPLED